MLSCCQTCVVTNDMSFIEGCNACQKSWTSCSAFLIGLLIFLLPSSMQRCFLQVLHSAHKSMFSRITAKELTLHFVILLRGMRSLPSILTGSLLFSHKVLFIMGVSEPLSRGYDLELIVTCGCWFLWNQFKVCMFVLKLC